MERALRNSIGLHLEYEDATPFGSMISGELEVRLKRALQPAVALLESSVRLTVEEGPSVLAELLGDAGPFFRASGGLRDEVILPPPADTRPAVLRVDRPDARPVRLSLPPSVVGDLSAWLGDWQRGATAPMSGVARRLWDALVDLDCMGPPRETAALPGAATFVGHATVAVSGPHTTLLIDPFLLPREDHFPPGYQPLTHGDLAPDAVLVTHSHPDHFHIDSLLRLGRDVPIYVPEVARESALAVDMGYRLEELGFAAVHRLGWHEETTIGDFRVVALPFYGEQPTTEAVLVPELRNAGNNYLVEGADHRFALIADAGRDHLGDVRQLATEAFERYGPVDVLFGGYRSWSLYPIQYAHSSVPQYLLFTPPSLWATRQQIMNDAHALLDTAERWHARHLVPYANGGAPWYSQLGLGPAMDGDGDEHSDPRPDAVLTAAAARSEDNARPLPSPVEICLMRPGDSLDLCAETGATIVANEGHRWPYAAHEAVATMGGAATEPLGLTKKRVLLRILADAEMRRRGVAVTTQQLADMSDDLRRQHGLVDQDDMLDWLDRAGLSMNEYCELLLEWRSVIQLETLMADAIEKRLPAQRAFGSMRDARPG